MDTIGVTEASSSMMTVVKALSSEASVKTYAVAVYRATLSLDTRPEKVTVSERPSDVAWAPSGGRSDSRRANKSAVLSGAAFLRIANASSR